MIRRTWNLSLRPFRNYRLYNLAFRAGVLAFAGLTFVHAMEIYSRTQERGAMQQALEELKSDGMALQQKTAAIRASLAGSDVKALNARVTWANQMIEARTFSWSRLLDDIEKVLPVNVLITSIAPSIKEGAVSLQLQTVSRGPGDLVDFLDALESSPYFSNAYPSGEREDVLKSLARGITSTVSVRYDPEAEQRNPESHEKMATLAAPEGAAEAVP